ncbi:transmembrane sensor [Pedobacter africanus]|uniref:Ferric-dicitrate binding protein FerR (Iron transport regulator) n=1 Tax=Pedobacter africanus TaxID=151894 RepID=A0ACC6L302_9SPHI|nr:FecR domain-containing protein [Pedobacter africanus]MDR6785729.1 ferric-dicitrate binding protein FerR (iron transport regulator) [Pedobacter africanus]
MSDRTFTIESLLTDETFINYCFKSNPEDVNYWQKRIDADAQLAALKQQALKLLELMANADIAESEINEGLSAFSAYMASTEKPRNSKLWFSIMGYAAALMLVLGIGWHLGSRNAAPPLLVKNRPQPVEIFNKAGQRMVVKLPDSSVVTLNGGSKISYDATAFLGKTRDLELQGEAFFEVTKKPDRPFTVKSGKLKVRVLGTKFNVNAYPDSKQLCVALVSGSVEVRNLDNRKIKQLKPMEMLAYDTKNNSIRTAAFDAGELTGWKDGNLVFKSANFNEIRHKLAIMYNVNLVNKSSSKNWSFNAEFKNENVQNIVKVLTRSKNLNYEVKNTSIIIRDK